MRAGTAIALALAGAVLVGCGTGSDGHTDASRASEDLPDCSSSGCAAEVAAYSDAVGALPGVTSVDLTYRAKQITDGASVSGDVRVGPGVACADLEEDLGRLLWESRLPVSTVSVSCFLPGASGSDYEYATYSFLLKDLDDLTQRWGPRGG